MVWVAAELQPEWARYWPGLLDWELDRLSERASEVVIDERQLRDGLLVVQFDWPFDGKNLRLEATYPGAYPFLRPHVRLLTEPETWPDRHVGPLDGSVCLLGRDSAQWTPDWYLVKLLDEQLEGALYGTKREDPQGEPADFWWNSLAPLEDSYCLVDSSWDLAEVQGGKLDISYVLGDKIARSGERLRTFRAVVSKVLSNNGTVIAEWNAPLPRNLRTSGSRIRVPWHRSGTTLLPRGDLSRHLRELRSKYFGGLGNLHKIAPDYFFRPFAIAHPVEISQNKFGIGWIIGGEWGTKKQIERKPGVGKPAPTRFIPVLRAGNSDIQFRVPAVKTLKAKTIAVFGVGAIGAPIAIELARNSCAALTLVDHDIVEPGNSIRWPLGAEAWGRKKCEALKDFIVEQFPGVTVKGVDHQIGGLTGVSDDVVIDAALKTANLVIDATASPGVTRLLWDRCQRRELPLLKASATPTLGGGTVVRYAAGGGCPICLEWAYEEEELHRPRGTEIDCLKQPPGCSERTFEGGDFDLRELSLQTVRLAVDTLTEEGVPKSLVQTLSLSGGDGSRILPVWEQHELKKHSKCCGASAR